MSKIAMSLRGTTSLLGAAFAVGLTALGASPAVAQEKMTAPAPGEAKPNILFIMGDDIGWMQPTRRRYGTRTGRCSSPWCPMHRQGSSLA